MPVQFLILATLALVVLVQLLALWFLARGQRDLRRRLDQLPSFVQETAKATERRMDRWERNLQRYRAARGAAGPRTQPAVAASPPPSPSPPKPTRAQYKDADVLVRNYNELVRDREQEKGFRGKWKPMTMEIDSSLGMRKADDGTFWLIPLDGGGQDQLAVPTRRLVSTDLTVLTAMDGGGARQLLGHLYDIETSSGNGDRALLVQAARLRRRAATGFTLVQRGRLRLP